MMRNILFLASLLFAVCANAQENPFVTSTEATFSPTAYSMVTSILSNYQGRGVAGVEQLRDELPALQADLLAGAVKDIADIRQPALKELFEEMAQKPELVAKLKEAHPKQSLVNAMTLTVMADLI